MSQFQIVFYFRAKQAFNRVREGRKSLGPAKQGRGQKRVRAAKSISVLSEVIFVYKLPNFALVDQQVSRELRHWEAQFPS